MDLAVLHKDDLNKKEKCDRLPLIFLLSGAVLVGTYGKKLLPETERVDFWETPVGRAFLPHSRLLRKPFALPQETRKGTVNWKQLITFKQHNRDKSRSKSFMCYTNTGLFFSFAVKILTMDCPVCMCVYVCLYIEYLFLYNIFVWKCQKMSILQFMKSCIFLYREY